MTPRPLRTENITAPVLFRVVDHLQPVLLLDEVDTFLFQDEELRGLINAGHKRGGCSFRCEGPNNAVRSFNAFAPAVLSGIGPLPATLRDRSICIFLVKAEEGEVIAHFNEFKAEIETELCRKLARWTQDNFAAIQACDPVMPKAAFNRLGDNWRPLFAIAQVAGGDWPARVLAAFTHLSSPPSQLPVLRSASGGGGSTQNSQLLLADIRQIFIQSGASRLFSSSIVSSLRALPDRPWSSNNNGHKPIDEPWLARQLRPFSVMPRNVRIGEGRARGYYLADFSQAFGDHLP
jgi:putative DNA primase/helicase